MLTIFNNEQVVSQECEYYNETYNIKMDFVLSYLDEFELDTLGNQFIILLCRHSYTDYCYYKLYEDSVGLKLKFYHRNGTNFFICVDEGTRIFDDLELNCKINLFVLENTMPTIREVLIIKNNNNFYYVIPILSNFLGASDCINYYSSQIFSIIVSFDKIIRKYYPTINNIIKGIPPPKLVNTIE